MTLLDEAPTGELPALTQIFGDTYPVVMEWPAAGAYENFLRSQLEFLRPPRTSVAEFAAEYPAAVLTGDRGYQPKHAVKR